MKLISGGVLVDFLGGAILHSLTMLAILIICKSLVIAHLINQSAPAKESSILALKPTTIFTKVFDQYFTNEIQCL